jgi:hypothetical protein
VIGRLGLADAVAGKLKRFVGLLNRHRRGRESDRSASVRDRNLSWRGRGVAYAGAIPEGQVVLSPAAMLERTGS